MGQAKSEPNLAIKSMVTWTSDDVKHWLKEHESLNKYTKQLKVIATMANPLLDLHPGNNAQGWFPKFACGAGHNRKGAHAA